MLGIQGACPERDAGGRRGHGYECEHAATAVGRHAGGLHRRHHLRHRLPVHHCKYIMYMYAVS